MLKLETERLILRPLTIPQLSMWMDDMSALETELACSYRAEPMQGVFREIVKEQYVKAAGHQYDLMFLTFWLIIRKADRVVVGSACFKGGPDEHGEVEIGYGLGKDYEGKGYMTEAVSSLCGWAKGQDGVEHVLAETNLDGIASHGVLKRCGFNPVKEAETIWWML